MTKTIYRYSFADNVSTKDAKDILLMAILSAEGLVGTARLQMEFRYSIEGKDCVINATHEVGYIVACIFSNLLNRILGHSSFNVDRAVETPSCQECCK